MHLKTILLNFSTDKYTVVAGIQAASLVLGGNRRGDTLPK
jgi:hypothetical protein